MRELQLNGYLDDDIWFGDEITPETLHDELYQADADPNEDLRIILNSYGGSCSAATRMYDELREYPGKVHMVISGTAASAATVLAMAADRLEMTPGSLYMIHDPVMGVYGNEADFTEAMKLLQVCKDSIINIYETRSNKSREELAGMMSATTWMDANAALANGFIDAIMEAPSDGIDNAAFSHTVNRADAEARVQNWMDRHKAARKAANTAKEQDPLDLVMVRLDRLDASMKKLIDDSKNKGTPAAQLEKRLSLLHNR